MASNRKQPFGYKMEWGEIVIQEREASVVRWIFQSYLTGASYHDLTKALEKGDVPYEVGKLWNKNMVARILENHKYTGQCDYPSLISQELFEAVQMRRKKQAAPSRKTPAQKELRRLCGGSPPPWVERQVLAVLNSLIAHPEQLRCPLCKKVLPAEAIRLRQELDDLLNTPPVDEDRARKMALHLAELQLNAIGPEEYETERLQRLFQSRSPMGELNQELLHESVRHITYAGRRVTILLKNHQTMEGGNNQ
ncbi:recombinase family protein [Pseudoflavonifractor capillosus]|uniref:recombinase family protein n=1 Tax=Pseudoflavonifractor capillosus TaxID=106588 RepID=UPI001956CB01|nr:recombinase family protein [Pseudoflavonifractor capillosus]MBM6682184.1 recombinase family protein [Pseudoflavonifractor capillosus]